jgi:hypothetical protein
MGNLVSLILIITSIGLFFGYTDPLYTRAEMDPSGPGIKVLRAQVAEYDLAMEKAEELRKVRDDLAKRYNNFTEDQKAQLQKILPDNIDNIRLIIEVNDKIAQAFGMNIRNFRTDAGTTENGDKKPVGKDNGQYGVLTLSFSTTATYDTFLDFLSALQSSLRIMDVSSIQFSAGSETGVYDYAVTLKTYWLK